MKTAFMEGFQMKTRSSKTCLLKTILYTFLTHNYIVYNYETKVLPPDFLFTSYAPLNKLQSDRSCSSEKLNRLPSIQLNPS